MATDQSVTKKYARHQSGSFVVAPMGEKETTGGAHTRTAGACRMGADENTGGELGKVK